jgi:predicted Zn finger-like uncharacterized protein
MSLITRCPSCGTMFKVVPDQLKISEGWVRCGHCADVFDAGAHLQAAVPPSAALAAETVEARSAGGAAATATAEPESQSFGLSASSEIDEGLPSEIPDSALIDAEAQALREHPLDRPFELRRHDSSEEREGALSEAVSEIEADSELTFVRRAKRRSFWARPFVRTLMRIAAVVLGLTLLLQVAVQDRDRLAASEPALRPWLATLCRALNCRISPLRKIEAIAIESSSFNQLRGEAYRLQVTLRNQGTSEVAVPALELTLTDSQDRPVIRRVLLPGELGPNAGVIPPNGEWSSSSALAVADSALGGRIAGYRLLAFYP